MNGAHLHLVVNHLPIIIPIIAFILMLGGFAMKSEILKRAAYGLFVLGAISAMVAFATGEETEEVVEHMAGVDESLIKVHEEKAETFAVLIYILGGISLVGMWASWKRASYSKMISIVAILFSLIVFIFAQQTGTTGGEIRHTEIRAEGANKATLLNQGESDEDNDD